MKKKIILLTAAIMLFGIMTVKAQETVDTSGQDWNDIVKSYNKNTIDRPITPQEFNQAVQTIKGLQKPPKKEKKTLVELWQKK